MELLKIAARVHNEMKSNANTAAFSQDADTPETSDEAAQQRGSSGQIISLGGRVYQIGDQKRQLSDPEDDVLQSYKGDAKRPAVDRLTEQNLRIRSGNSDPFTVLRRLKAKFNGLFAPAARTRPTCKDGWGVRIKFPRSKHRRLSVVHLPSTRPV